MIEIINYNQKKKRPFVFCKSELAAQKAGKQALLLLYHLYTHSLRKLNRSADKMADWRNRMDQIVNKVKAQLFAKGVDNMQQLQDVFLVSLTKPFNCSASRPLDRH